MGQDHFRSLPLVPLVAVGPVSLRFGVRLVPPRVGSNTRFRLHGVVPVLLHLVIGSFFAPIKTCPFCAIIIMFAFDRFFFGRPFRSSGYRTRALLPPCVCASGTWYGFLLRSPPCGSSGKQLPRNSTGLAAAAARVRCHLIRRSAAIVV